MGMRPVCPVGMSRLSTIYEAIKAIITRITSAVSKISPILERVFKNLVFCGSTLGIFVKVVGRSIGSLLHYSLEKPFLIREME